ncbi:MAG: T9SS type A sorting domain-containing protein [Ignavibacteriales bacterium]|nr:T9SS type A sorting domain-containing protein [Ignavibacteriales bacterium]
MKPIYDKSKLLFLFLIFLFTSLNYQAQDLREPDSKQSSKIYSPSNSNNLFLEKTNADIWNALGPKGICVQDLAIDPLNNNKIIAGGLSGLYITTNGGTNWNIANSMFYNVRIGGVKFHPTYNNIIIANGYSYTTGSSYIYRSTDGGTNWTIVKTTNGLNDGKIVFAKNDPSIIYSEGYYLYRSSDAGVTWTEYTSLPKIETYDVFDQDPNKLYAFAYQPASPYNYELFYSLNGGVTWTKIKTLSYWYGAIKISTNDFSQVYAGSTDRTATGGYGFLKSVDGGNNWTVATTGFGKFSKISFIAFHPTNSNIIYACGSGTSLMKSIDAGVNWTDIMPSIIDRYVYGIQFDSQNNLYVFTGSNIYKTTNEISYQSLSGDLVNTDIFQIHFSPANYSVIYLASLGGVIKTTNGGQTWVQKSNGIYDNDIFSLGINPQNTNTIFAGSFGSVVYRTTDGGENWIEKTTGLTGLTAGSINAFGFHPQNPTNVFLLEGSSKIFSSTNSGDSWTEYKVNNESIKALDISPSSKNIWYAYTASGGKIYKSTDYGSTWTLQSTTINLYSITVDATNPSILYADQYINSQDNISKSTDSGVTWNIVYPNLYIRDIYSVPGAANTLYASSWGSGVYKTTDGGTNWAQSNVGLTYQNCFMVRNQPGSTSSFLVATYGGGVFGFNYTPTNVKNENNIIPTQFSLEQNYPNPFNPSTKIRYSLPQSARVKIILYNVLGVQIMTLVDSEQTIGNHETELNGSNLASGVYFVRMNADNYSVTKKIMLMK